MRQDNCRRIGRLLHRSELLEKLHWRLLVSCMEVECRHIAARQSPELPGAPFPVDWLHASCSQDAQPVIAYCTRGWAVER